MAMMTLYARQQKRYRCVERTFGLRGRGRGWDDLGEWQIELPYDPAIPLLDIHTEETRIERDTCTPMFITALFIITRTWKQLRCPPTDEWIRNMW